MPLQKQKLTVPFVGTRDAGTARFLRPPASLQQLQNAVSDETGQVVSVPQATTLGVTYFDAALTPVADTHTGLLAGGRHLVRFYRDSNLFTGLPQLGKYVDVRDAWRPAQPGNGLANISDVTVTVERGIAALRVIQKTTPMVSNQIVVDFVINGDYGCFVVLDTETATSTARYILMDLTSFQVVQTGTIDSEANINKTRVVKVGTGFFFVYYFSGGNLRGRALTNITSGNPTLGSEVTLASDATGAQFDVLNSDVMVADTFTLAYTNTDDDVAVKRFNTAGTAVATATPLAATADVVVHLIDITSTAVYVVYLDDTGTFDLTSVSLNSSLVFGTPSVIETLLDTADAFFVGGSATADATNAVNTLRVYFTTRLLATVSENTRCPKIVKRFHASAGITNIAYGAVVIGHPLARTTNEAIALIETSESSIDSAAAASDVGTVALIGHNLASGDTGLGKVMAVVAPNGTAFQANRRMVRPQFYANEMLFPVLLLGPRLGSTTGVAHEAHVGLVRIGVPATANDVRSVPYFTHSNSLFFGGGKLHTFDGRTVGETGFHRGYPEYLSTVEGGSGNLTVGDIGIAFVYTWLDANGLLHRSTPTFFIKSVSGGANRHLDVKLGGDDRLHNILKTSRTERVKIEIYRTTVGGSVYYLENTYDIVETAQYRSAVIGLVTDAALIGKPVLYTMGGLLGASAIPSPYFVTADADIAVLIPADDRKALWLSKPLIGGTAPEFSNLLVLTLQEGGDNEAVAFIDNRIIVFKTDQVRVLAGGRPDARGFGAPNGSQPITTEFGCNDWRSVAQMKDGVLFRSSKGWMFLDRSMNINYIGEKVRDFDSKTLVRTLIDPVTQQVRAFFTDGTVLIWDYRHGGIWSVLVYPFNIRDVAIYNDTFYMLADTGRVYYPDLAGPAFRGQTSPAAAVPDVFFLGATYSSVRDLFVVVGSDGNVTGEIQTSPDGKTWTRRTLADNRGLNAITAARITPTADQFIAVGDVGTGTIQTSSNGTTWTSRTSNVGQSLRCVAANGQTVVAAGNGAVITRSTNGGATWAAQTAAGDFGEPFFGAAFGAGLFVLVGDSGTIQTSPTGVTWTARTSGTGRDLFAITFDGTQFVAVGDLVSLTSPDGITWTVTVIGVVGYSVHYNGRAYYMGAANVATPLVSADATTWLQPDDLPDIADPGPFEGDSFASDGDTRTIFTGAAQFIGLEHPWSVTRSSWFRVNAIGGAQRVWRAAVHGLARHGQEGESLITVRTYLDFDESTVVDTFHTTATALQTANDAPIEWHGRLVNQRCQAIMIEVSWRPVNVDTAAPAFSAATLEIGSKPGVSRSAPGVPY